MLDNITKGLIQALEQAGLEAGRAYPRSPLADGGVFVKIGLASARQSESGFARFLGLKEREEDKALIEVYGMKCELELRLDIYAGMEQDNAAARCETVLDDIMAALAQYGGLSLHAVSCGEAAPDRETGFFRCRCTAQAGAELMFESAEETGEFTDFILKGELRR